ncbi:MAG TPA: hypothetical protein VGH54_21395 [Mycobacterium sp.]|jgi:hypothetical protein|uniref:hypothetical protein n=1 Tax=Mycobacterium sp. TaxID=1785 RepID=UPI002F3FB7C8
MTRNQAVASTSAKDQEEVTADAMELLALQRVLAAALARDSAGPSAGKAERHGSGGAKGSAASINLEVLEVAVVLETGIDQFAAEAVRILNLDRRPRTVFSVIVAIPDWHRALVAAGQPLARHLRGDLEKWLRMTRRAVGLQRRDIVLRSLCPDHRGMSGPLCAGECTHTSCVQIAASRKPTNLRQLGEQAAIAESLAAGPPRDGRLSFGPTCAVACTHLSCEWIRERRLVLPDPPSPARRRRRRRPQPSASDWVVRVGETVWESQSAEPAFTWSATAVIHCPHCRRRWATVVERRLLARELATAGDDRSTVERMLA